MRITLVIFFVIVLAVMSLYGEFNNYVFSMFGLLFSLILIAMLRNLKRTKHFNYKIDNKLSNIKTMQIISILNFNFSRKQGRLSVSRQEIREYVSKHGLPRRSLKSAELGYKKIDNKWRITYYEKGCNIGEETYVDIIDALEPILDYALPEYVKSNPWNQTHA